MIIAVTGIRDIAEVSAPDVLLATIDAAVASKEMLFGGAKGADTQALDAACGITRCRVILPAFLSSQPLEARTVIRDCADVIEELAHPAFPKAEAYYARNRALVDGADRLLAFTDGKTSGGTHWTMQYAASRGVPVDAVSVVRESPAADLEERVARGITGEALSRPTFAYAHYSRTDWRTQAILALKKGKRPSEQSVSSLVRELVKMISDEPDLRGADAIAPMPRRIPGQPGDLDELAARIADETGKTALTNWLVRTEDPTGGKVIARRVRFQSVEHARTLGVVDRSIRPRRVIVLDNVLTVGGTMEGAFQAIARDAPGVSAVGLAILYASGVEMGV